MPRPAIVSGCGSGPTGHRWRRLKVELPSDSLEENFSHKVRAHVRQRRACQRLDALGAAAGAPAPGPPPPLAPAALAAEDEGAWEAASPSRPSTSGGAGAPGAFVGASPPCSAGAPAAAAAGSAPIAWASPPARARSAGGTPRGGPRYLANACLPSVYADRLADRHARREALAAAARASGPAPLLGGLGSAGAEAASSSAAAAGASAAGADSEAGERHAVVEASRSLFVTMEEGEVEQVPPNSWLVLEEPLQEALGFPGHRKLSSIAGGGVIQQQGVPALRSVPPERLCAPAAEANFRRASRGASLVALRHATLALGLFGNQEPAARQEPGYVPMASAQGASSRLTDEELLDRARRVASLVACQAAAASQRQAMATAAAAAAAAMVAIGSLRSTESTRPRDLHERRHSVHPAEVIPGKSHLQKGFNVFASFQTFLIRRFGNPVRAWFMLDNEENMRLGQKQFERRCAEVGFKGNLGVLWKYLDDDGSGTIGITEFHSKAAQVLAGFKWIMKARFRDDLDIFFRALDENNRGRLTRPEFIAAMQRVGYEGPVGMLFDYLDRRGVGTVSDRDVNFMRKWSPPPYIFCEPNLGGLRNLKAKFNEVYHTPLRVWLRCFDRNGNMTMSWPEFIEAAADLSKRTKTPPWSVEALAPIWRALDTDCSGSITLKEWCEDSYDALAEFKTWATRVHGSVVKAFRAMDSNSGNAKLSMGELIKAKRGADPCRADLELIFDGLDLNDSWALTENDVKFLDHWDLAYEQWMENAKRRLCAPIAQAQPIYPRMGFGAGERAATAGAQSSRNASKIDSGGGGGGEAGAGTKRSPASAGAAVAGPL